MGDYIEEEKWWRGAFHEAGHVVALVSLGIVPTHVDVSIRGGGFTAVERLPADWTDEQDDAVILAGIVAEQIYRDNIDDTISTIRYNLNAPTGDDWERLHEQDSCVIARRMEELKEYFQNGRWKLVQEIAGALMEYGAIDNKNIETIYLDVIGTEEIGRIASRAMRQRLKNEIRQELQRRLTRRQPKTFARADALASSLM